MLQDHAHAAGTANQVSRIECDELHAIIIIAAINFLKIPI